MAKKISIEEEKAIKARRLALGLDKPVVAPKNLDKEIPTITLTDCINEYSQLCQNLEDEINELVKSLSQVLVNIPEKLSPYDGTFISAPKVSDIVSINRCLEKQISTLYNLRINLGI